MEAKPLVNSASDAGHEIHEIEDPKFSPDGKWVSFVRDSNLWVANIATGKVQALTTGGSEEILKGQLDWVYPEELDATTAYWWSPDSSKIAYYQMDERPVTRFPIVDMSSLTGAIEYTRFPRSRRSESNRARGRRPGHRRRNEMDGYRRGYGCVPAARRVAAR